MEPIRLRNPVNPTKPRENLSGLGATFADALRTGPAKRDEPVDPSMRTRSLPSPGMAYCGSIPVRSRESNDTSLPDIT
jgi:hypothetical protein